MSLVLSNEMIQCWRERLEAEGYLYLQDLPADLDHYAFAQSFGRLLPQYDGEHLWRIKADPQFDDLYHSLNTKKLSPHTECYEFQGIPPRYLALWCVRPAGCGGGQTTLYDAMKYFRSLPPAFLAQAESERFSFRSSSGIQKSKLSRTAHHPFVGKTRNGRSYVRFSYNNVDFGDHHALQEAARRLCEDFESSCVAIDWTPGAFLIWDNHRLVHSRTAYSDRERELRRVWLTDGDELSCDDRQDETEEGTCTLTP